MMATAVGLLVSPSLADEAEFGLRCPEFAVGDLCGCKSLKGMSLKQSECPFDGRGECSLVESSQSSGSHLLSAECPTSERIPLQRALFRAHALFARFEVG